MEIFDFAVKMEREGESYYRSLSEKVSHRGYKGILNLLAEEERAHAELIEKVHGGKEPQTLNSPVLKEAVSVFADMKVSLDLPEFSAGEVELYKKALVVEEKSYEFYQRLSNESLDPLARKVFRNLAKEEKKHCFLMESLIAFVAHPKVWVENAEFNHLEEY